MALKLKFSEAASSSNMAKIHWGVIWSRKILEKIKVFIWKAAKNLLPIICNLWKRKVIKEPICHRCQVEEEDIFHALLRCRYARKVWKLIDFYQDIEPLVQQDMLSALQELATCREGKDVELIIAVCWSIGSLGTFSSLKARRKLPNYPLREL